MRSRFQLVFISLVLVGPIFSLQDDVPSIQDSTPCMDTGIWIGGHISCTAITSPSSYGLHNDPRGICNKYGKECCQTCRKLFGDLPNNQMPDIKTHSPIDEQKTALELNTNQAPILPMEKEVALTENNTPCTDTGIWIAGLISCTAITRPSSYGLHNDPRGICNKYGKECCQTCRKLFNDSPNDQMSIDIKTQRPIDEQKIALRPNNNKECIDTGIRLGDGLVSCRNLVEKSGYNFHTNPRTHCQKYQKECCLTCQKIIEIKTIQKRPNPFLRWIHNMMNTYRSMLMSINKN